ncbi:MAG: xanthine dehydrogenase family protein molybdopterin-binding subunit [Candidatus Tectomicrobia bacterium]|nr:xanthine dehydrogenase family protein molybdopterin-binding subunit [Candidatus Tectomicrobia bacterium]
MTQRYVGAALKRLEDPRLLTGQGCYAADLSFDGMLHLAVLRSTHAHALLRRVDVAAARRVTGVAAALCAKDIPEITRELPMFTPFPVEQPANLLPLAREKVRYVGEPIACVAAESRYLAEDAVEQIVVEYEPLPAVIDLEQALDPTTPRIHERHPSNLCTRVVQRRGDFAAAAAAADLVIRERFRIKCSSGMPMETRGLVASFDADSQRLTVWPSAQMPHGFRAKLAVMLDLPVEQIHVIAPDVGGGFGVKGGFYPEDVLVPYLARRLRRAVKFVEDRHEHFVGTFQETLQLHDAELAVRRDGTLLGLRDHYLSEAGAYAAMSVVTPNRVAMSLLNSYHIPAYDIQGTHVYTTRVPLCPVRGAGRPQANFVIERLLDFAAAELGLDPLEVRARNLIQPHEFPYDTGLKTVAGAPIRYDSGNYPALLDTLRRHLDVPAFRAEQARLRQGAVYRGLGMTMCVEPTGAGLSETSRVELDDAGGLRLHCGSPSQGQGIGTSLAQVVADVFGVPPEGIRVGLGDTDGVPDGVGTFGSRVAILGANATFMAAQTLLRRLKELAAEHLEVDAADLEVGGGGVSVRGSSARGVSLQDLAAIARRADRRLEATERFEGAAESWASSSTAAIVEVDPQTGHVRVLRYATVHDCGTVLNPLIVEGQVQGGVAHGIGEALFEEMYFDENGQALVGSFMDYPMPAALEVPRVETLHQETPSPWNPLGTKGAGEAGTIAALGVLAAAVEDALGPFGVRIREIPLHPPKVARLVAEGRASD